MPLSTSQRSFLDKIFPHAVAAGQKSGIDPYVIMSQAALETGYGAHAPNNNYFGIKGPGGTQRTTEYVNGKPVTINDSFRGYASLGDSVQGYVDFLSSNRRYRNVFTQPDGKAQIGAIAAAGYATDPAYAQKVSSIYDTISGVFGNGGSGSSGDTFPAGRRRT